MEQAMLTRVLVVLPFYGGSLPVGHYCVEALRECGCLVDVFDSPSFYPAYKALQGLGIRQEKLEYLESAYTRVLGDGLLAQVERFQPDLVLCMAQAPVGIPVLKRLRSDGVPTAMWFVEDYRLFTYWRAFAPYYDIFAVIQKEPLLSQLAGAGVENALYLPMAAHPGIHKKVELTPADKKRFGAQLSFMGAGYPNRRQAFRQLADYDFKIWGTEWDGEPNLEKFVQMQGRRIDTEDTVRIFNAAEINLNLHSGTKRDVAVTHGDFVNPRAFEIAACGAFQLVDRRTLMPELFNEDELAVFDSMEELLTKVNYYLAHPEERADVARKGQERVLREHTYAARMRTLLDFAASRLPDWPRAKNGLSLEKALGPLPEDLKEGLGALLLSLQLPPNTDFETLMAALRARSGKLTHLESALLFLDEWKKQYQRG